MQLPQELKGVRNKYLIVDAYAYGEKVKLLDMTLTGVDFTIDDNQWRIIDVLPYYSSDLKDIVKEDIFMLIVVSRDKISVNYAIKKWRESDEYQALIRGCKLDDIIKEKELIDDDHPF